MSSDHQGNSRLGALTLAALGIVFGDIGTSPLYAFKEAFNGPHALAISPENVLATLSALLWAVLVIVSIKYVWIVLKYDNDGEGGVLALTALAHRLTRDAPRRSLLVVSAGVFAAALFYGDAIITPAISVLSAVEGISVATPRFEHFIIPITIGILIGLFFIQKHGTGSVGTLFGPITVVWFLTLGGMGIHSIVQTPMVLQAISPHHALQFTLDHPGSAFILLSAVFLALTGGEALYADMGHFGRKAVRLGWYALVFPCLILNYFGQGALVLRDAHMAANPFFLMAPQALLIPLVILWFGIDESAKLFLVALGVFFPVYLNTFHGIRSVDQGLIEMARSYGVNGWRLYAQVILPGATASILVGLRFSLGLMWVLLIVAETLSAQAGIGYMTMNAREFLQTDVVLVGILIYALLGKVADWVAQALERGWLRWHPGYQA
mgnify:CR=1 FL=1